MIELIKPINYTGIENLSIQQMIELGLVNIISIRNYLIWREYEMLIEKGERKLDAMRILAGVTWIDSQGNSMKIGYKSIQHIIYQFKDLENSKRGI